MHLCYNKDRSKADDSRRCLRKDAVNVLHGILRNGRACFLLHGAAHREAILLQLIFAVISLFLIALMMQCPFPREWALCRFYTSLKVQQKRLFSSRLTSRKGAGIFLRIENSWKRTRLRNFGKGDICVGIAGNGDDISATGYCTAGKKMSHTVIAGSAQQVQAGAAEVQIDGGCAV